jgi:hypothetical protein
MGIREDLEKLMEKPNTKKPDVGVTDVSVTDIGIEDRELEDRETLPIFNSITDAVRYLRTLTTKNNTIWEFNNNDSVVHVVCQTRDRAGYLLLKRFVIGFELKQVSRDKLLDMLISKFED